MSHETNTEPGGDDARTYDLLCRYVFGEATDGERLEIEEALAASEELRAQKAELEATVALVQGAMGAPAAESGGAEPAELAPERIAALTAAAAAAGGEPVQGGFELKPVGSAPKRPWYRDSVVQFAAAATVMLGVGVMVLSEPKTNSGADAGLAMVDSEEAEQLFEGARTDLRKRSEELGVSSDMATVPRDADAATEAMKSMGYLGYSSLGGPAPASGAYKGPGDTVSPGASSRSQAAAPRGGAALTQTQERQLQGLGYGGGSNELTAGVRRSRKAAGATREMKAREVPQSVGLNLSPPASSAGPSSPGPGAPAAGAPSGVASGSEDFFLGRGKQLAPKVALEKKEGLVVQPIEAPEAVSLTLVDELGDRASNSAEIELPDAELWRLERREQLQLRPGERPRDMFFRFWGDNPFVVTRNDALSTFAADVDTASFALARRMLREGKLPQRAQIRTEEFVNFLRPDLEAPAADSREDFTVHGELAPSPFGAREDRWLLRVGLRARDIDRSDRPPLALTFVVDTSGSMRTDNRLELVKHALRLLVDQLDDRDSLSIVGFSNSATEVLPPTPASARDVIETALFGMQPGGGTNAEAGLKLGYALSLGSDLAGTDAQRRVVFLSDGVANVGQTDQDRLAADVSGYADQGIFLNTIGVGMTNHNDVFLEQLADKGQGVCDYVGDATDARRAIVERFISGFFTVAKDVKIQLEFDGAKVLRWRQLGYENRAVADRDFRNDAVDAGEIGAGHQVTCFYEIELASGAAADESLLAKVRLRYKPTKAFVLGSRITETVEREAALTYGAIAAPSFRGASAGFRLGALSAQFAEFLRRSYHTRGDSLERLSKGLANLLADAPSEDAATIAEAFRQARALGLKALPAPRPTDDDAAAQAAYYQALIESLGGADPGALKGTPDTGSKQGSAPAEGSQKGSGKAPTQAEYETRIRELLNGDRQEKPH